MLSRATCPLIMFVNLMGRYTQCLYDKQNFKKYNTLMFN